LPQFCRTILPSQDASEWAKMRFGIPGGGARNSAVPASLDVPELVRQRAASNGSAGQRWLDDLPELVASLAEQWDLVLGESFRGGTASFVAAATDQSGRACVLKIAMPLDMDERDSFHRSVLVHQLAGGRGCALLYEYDDSAPAMLLERLGRNLAELDLPLSQVLETIATTLRTFWRPVGDVGGLPTAVDKARWLADYIATSWGELGRPCGHQVVDRALAYCDERAGAFDPSQAILVHGDAHGWNTVEAGAGTFKFVDPEGLRSEAAHDLGVPMREYNAPLLEGDTQRLVWKRAEMLAELCDVDADAVWQWGFIERVSTGLANVRDFEGGDGAVFLEVATRCL
jgi:streptomycin 6-kinase